MGILVGYDNVGYRVLMNGRIIIARHVEVVEDDVKWIGIDTDNESESESETSYETFLNGKVKSEIYVKIPQGYENVNENSDKVLKLEKALYGLRESPRAWYECFDNFINRIYVEYDLEKGKLSLDQTDYINSLGNVYNLENTKLYSTLMEERLHIPPAQSASNEIKYRNLIGALLYINCYVDADWAGDKNSRQSTTGFVIRYYGNTIFWKVKKQSSVAKSSTAAEYVALSDAVSEIKVIKNLLKDLDVNIVKPIKIYEDNSGAIAIAKYDKKLNQLTNDVTNNQKDLIEYEQKLDLAKKYSTELQNQLNSNRNETQKLQESLKRLEKENIGLRRQKNELIDENNSLNSNIERKDIELERLRLELASLGSQLQISIAAKCQALAKIEEVQSRELNIEFREKRSEQERVLFVQQVFSLEEELSKRTMELQNVRSEASARNLLIQTRLSQCEEELQIANDSIVQIREANTILQRRHEELTQKLDDQRNHEIAMHSSYREEITAQIRLADVYKGMADEANAKVDDYNVAVKELQDLLEHATEQYGILETTHNKLVLDYENDNISHQNKISKLMKELEDANELLGILRQERLDQAVEQLAPTAAIANRILKKGLSLTQIYTQFVEVSNELSSERRNNEKIKSQMDIILNELEEKAPILQQQREDYELAIANVTTLTLRIDELLIENSRLQENTNEANRLVSHFTKENQKLKSELADLAKQVCYLLKEVEEKRIGETIPMSEANSVESNNLASSQIISRKLVTFRDIESLQENNQKLLSIVRILSSRQEEIEKATDEINSGVMKEKLERYIEQLNEMQAAQNRQAKMLEGILKQRDMYKKMYQQCVDQRPLINNEDKLISKKLCNNQEEMENENSMNTTETTDKTSFYDKKSQVFENQFKQLNNDFETYKNEKAAHEKMLNNEIERLRKEAENNSTRCCRLKVQLDSANERFSLLQGNVATYKSQIKILEDKCNSYNLTIGKHEQSLMILKDEALSAQSRLSKAEVQVENLKQERQLLRDSEGRLLKEREVLQRERHTHALLKADVEVIKTSLERVQAEQQLRTEQRLDDATRECAALRRRLQEEQDRFRELSTNLERQINISKERLLEETKHNQQIKTDLDNSRQSEQECIKKIEELNNKLKEATSLTLQKPVISGDDSLNKKIKDLEIQLVNNQSEIKSLIDQLKAARFQGQQYCDIAESTEAQLREMTDQFRKLEKDYNVNMKKSEDKVGDLNNTIKLLEEKISKLSNVREDSDSELRKIISDSEEKVQAFDEIKIELDNIKLELKAAVIAASVAEDKYAREMVLHSADLQMLTKIKEENQKITDKLAELMQEHDSAKSMLHLEKSMWQEREQRYVNEIEELKKRIEDLDAQNILLHNQIQELSERTAILHSQNISTSDFNSSINLEFVNRSFDEEDQKSVEQLLQVMKYLRREKDLALAKFDVLKSENSRLKSQIDLSEKRFEELKKSIDRDRENNEIDVLTVSKHAELLRKVETLNAITDSNRVLREERDLLNNKIGELTCKVKQLSEEVIPLREKVSDLQAKNESLIQENNSLKSEVLRWRQRANTLIERSSKATPEDWRRLQTERENLSKLLTSEREVHAKCMDELNILKNEKSRLEDQFSQIQKQIQSREEVISRITDDNQLLNNNFNDVNSNLNQKLKEIENLKKEILDKEALLVDVRNKEIQIRKIAKKYKTQYEELSKTLEEEKMRIESQIVSNQVIGQKQIIEDDSQLISERESKLREEGRSEFRQVNQELTLKVEELNRKIISMQSESDNLKKEIELINKTSLEKEEKAKQVLKGARTKIMQLTEYKKYCEKEVNELKEKLESSTSEIESSTSEYETRLAALKSQMEGRISRLEHERSDLQAEKESLIQRATQLQRQLVGQGNPNTGTSEPPTANIKPMSARAETPLASIRPMSVVVQSRTAAVLPTTVGNPLLSASQQSSQQLVHTTETSSPTSSHIDYQPVSTSRQHLIQTQINESAESTLREEPEVDQQQQQACPQQAVALVSPRIEQQQQQSLPSDQQTVPSSSTQPVSTSHPSNGIKRPRTLDSTGSNLNENMDLSRQEQLSSPKNKRSRQQELTSASGNTSDIEYQVPTSSQRDQDEEAEDHCIVVVDCDEGNITHQHAEEEFENDPYEEIEDEELPYGVEVEGDNNEVEIILGEDSANVEIPQQMQSELSTHQQQQSETISSAGVGELSAFVSRQSRNSGHRQHPQQHLLLPQQGYEDGGDDCIVPSTPTLFVPRRNDGFGEAVSSPQVPSRFTFGEPSNPALASTTQSHSTNTMSGARAIFSSTPSELAQVVEEGMDDTRIDLTQLDDNRTGRSVPTTPRQVSPNTEQQESTNTGSSDDHSVLVNVCLETENTENLINIKDSSVNPSADEEPEHPTEVIEHGSNENDDSKVPESRISELIVLDINNTNTEQSDEIRVDLTNTESKDENREAEASPSDNAKQGSTTMGTSNVPLLRGATARRSTRTSFRTIHGTRPTPIVWDNQSSSRGSSTNRGHSSRGSTNENIRARGSRGRRLRSKYPYNY
ncbi:nucleoprotein TPR [Phymastichus coffea]|uniref:nucleoprotein TPR n=1 Tax=Phymastichus coffea TaxID=108790 RepID=UPI00273B79E3|nr:nucleoprotein TPR [Phymastichus coffea]